MSFLRTAAAWLLDPAKRKAFYGLLGAAAPLLVLFGVATDSAVTGWVGVVVAVLDLLALVLGMVKAHRVDVKILYAGFAVALGAFKTVGILSDGQVSYVLDLATAGFSFLPMVVLFLRTDPRTPTGEMQSEYVARHAAQLVVAADMEREADEQAAATRPPE